MDKVFLLQLSVTASNCPAVFSPIYMQSVTIRGIFRVFDIKNNHWSVFYVCVYVAPSTISHSGLVLCCILHKLTIKSTPSPTLSSSRGCVISWSCQMGVVQTPVLFSAVGSDLNCRLFTVFVGKPCKQRVAVGRTFVIFAGDESPNNLRECRKYLLKCTRECWCLKRSKQ